MAIVVIESAPVRHANQKVVALITAAHGLSHFYQILFPSLFAFVARDLALNYTQLGVIMTFFFAASGVGQVLSGFAVDKFGGRRLLLIGVALLAIAFTLFGLVSSFYAMMLCALIAGAGNSVFHPADFSLLNHLVSPPRIPWAFSLHGIGGNIGYVAAPFYAVAATTAFGWKNAFLLSGFMGAAILVALMREPALRTQHGDGSKKPIPAAQKEAALPEKNSKASLMHVLLSPLLHPLIFGAFAFFCITTVYTTAINTFGPAIFNGYHQLPLERATLLLTIYLIAQTVGMFLGGYINASGIAPGQIASRAAFLAATISTLLLIPGLGFLGLALVLSVVGLANGTVAPSRDMIVKKAAPKRALGRAYGVVYSGFDIGASLVPIAYGALIDHQRVAIVIGCIVIGFFANGLVARWLDQRTGEQRED